MSWFFKVSKGWAPYSTEQSSKLETAYNDYIGGKKDHVDLGETWRVDFDKMLQYRSDDPGRSRAVKRDAPAPSAAVASSAASSSANADSPTSKKRKLLSDLLTTSNEDLAMWLKLDDTTQLSERLNDYMSYLACKRMAVEGGQATSEPCVVLLRSDHVTSHGQTFMSPMIIKTVRVFARIGSQLVMFWARSTEVVNAEASNEAFKLTTLVGEETEGELLYPPPPFELGPEGKQSDVLYVPLSFMQNLKDRCGCTDDPRPANVWMKAVLEAFVKVLEERHKEHLDENMFDMFGELLQEHFDEQYIPSKIMTCTEMLKEKEEQKAATAIEHT